MEILTKDNIPPFEGVYGCCQCQATWKINSNDNKLINTSFLGTAHCPETDGWIHTYKCDICGGTGYKQELPKLKKVSYIKKLFINFSEKLRVFEKTLPITN